MVLNNEIHTAELVYAGQNVSVTETATSFVNERQKVEISLMKTLETSDLFGIGQNGEMKNISFGLFAAEELVSASGTSIPVDGLIEIVTLDESGNGTVKTDLPNRLADDRGLKPSTIDSIHTVLHQVFDMAVDDNYIRSNPSSNVLRELKQSHCFQTEKRRGLTKPEQDLFLDFLRNSHIYSHWYPIFAIMVGTGLRVGELTGLRWCDVDLEEGIIDVNHTLLYYSHRDEGYRRGSYYNVNTPKTKASIRQVPMLDFVKEAFSMEREYQEAMGIRCEATIDGYTDFIFLNQFGDPQNLGNLNKAIRRIIRDCNDEAFLKEENPAVLLPNFSCHSLRHTFTTRMCEAEVNVKVIQDTLGHQDISTTLNIYADVTKELKQKEFAGLDMYFTKGQNSTSALDQQ